MEVGPVANAREGSMQEHDWDRVTFRIFTNQKILCSQANQKKCFIYYFLTLIAIDIWPISEST